MARVSISAKGSRQVARAGGISTFEAKERLMGFFRFKREKQTDERLFHLSPLDPEFVRLNVAAREIVRRDVMLDETGVFDLLVRALWNGDFDPEYLKQIDNGMDGDQRDALWMPIAVPHNVLPKHQRNLSPRPIEYHKGGRSLALHVMFFLPGLPGELAQWKAQFDAWGDAAKKLEAENFHVLQGYPVSDYTEAGQKFLKSIYVPREMLQIWLNDQTDRFENLFVAFVPDIEKSNSAAPDEHITRTHQSVVPFPRRGRRKSPAWDFVREEVVKLFRAEPSLLHKAIAHRVHQLALKHFDAPDVPSESSIMRRIPEFLVPPGRWH
jgi:hypothetical protein